MKNKIRKRFENKPNDEQYKIAGDYLMENASNDMIERDLLLREMKYKDVVKVKKAADDLRKMANIEPEKPIVKQLKGGILDGIRRSKKDSR